jgi:hypothetical protein
MLGPASSLHGITRRMTGLGLTVDDVAEHAYPEQLGDDPHPAFNTILLMNGPRHRR